MKLDKLDVLFSEFIRRRAIKLVGGCERCLSQKHDTQKDNGDIYPAWRKLQCSHYFGRKRKMVRWDEDNAAGLCAGCHMYLTSHPHEHAEFFKQRLGDTGVLKLFRYDLLVARASLLGKPDKSMLELYFKERIKVLDEQQTTQDD